MNMDQLAFENLIMDLQLIRWGNLTNEELDRIMDAITQAKNNAKAEQDKRGGQRVTFEELAYKVEDWAREKGIDDYENWEKQFMKFQEETFELYKEMALHDARLKDKNIDIYIYDKEDMKLEMGDILVTLIVLAKQQDIELSDCLSMAWNKIKNRRGKTINGQFVKEEDLK